MAVDYHGITIEIDGDTSKLSERLKELREDSKYVYQGLRDINGALKFDDDNVTLLTQKQTYLSDAIENTKQRIDAYRAGLDALDKVKEESGALDVKQQAQYDQLERSIIKCTAQVESYQKTLHEVMQAESSQQSMLGTVASSFEDLGSRLTATGQHLQQVGDAATMGITVPLVAGAKAAVDAAVEIDSSFHDLTKTADGTESEMQALKESAIALSETQPVSASEILQIEAMGAQLGYANDKLEGFAETVSGLSIATDLGTEEAAMQLAQFSNVMGTAQEDSSRFGSTVVDLGNSFSTVESSITDMAMGIAAAGKQVGMSEADVLGLSTALASVGINAEAGGTAISTIMSKIDKDVATNSDNLDDWASAAGMSASEFAQAWRDAPVKAIEALLGGLKSAVDSGGNMTVMLEELGIQNVRQSDTIKRLASASTMLEGAVSTANQAWRDNTALSEEVANRNDSLASKIDVLKNRVQNLLAEVGEPIAEALLNILDAAQPLFDLIESGANAFSNLSDSQQQLIVTAGAIAAAYGPISSVFGRTLEVIGSMSDSFGSALESFQLFKMGLAEGEGVIGSLGVAFSGLGEAIVAALPAAAFAAAIAAIAALGTAIMDGIEHENAMREATEGLESAVTGMADSISSAYNTDVTSGLATSADEIKKSAESLLKAQQDLKQGIDDTWSEVGTNGRLLDTYLETIDDLTEKSSLSKGEQEKLKQAVSEFNAICGTSISIINGQTGELSLNEEALHRVADAYKEYAQAQAAMEVYNDITKQLIENQVEQAKYQEVLSKGYDKMGLAQALMSGATLDEIDATQKASIAMAEAKEQEDALKRSLEAAESVMDGISTTTEDLEATYRSLGATAGDTADDVSSAANQIGDSADDAADDVKHAAEEARLAVEAATTAMRRAQEDEMTSLKRAQEDEMASLKSAQDAAYNATKDFYASQEKALSDSLSAAYNETKKQMDKELDLLKSEYKKQEQALSDALSKEYDQQKAAYDQQIKLLESHLKERAKSMEDSLRKERDSYAKSLEQNYKETEKSLSKALDAYKAELKRGESELKKSLDRQYKERSKAAQKEAKQWQKENQRVLKDAKATYSAQTKAFKDETSARIAEIKREYEAKKKAIADNDGTSSIDAQIKQLEDEQAAEDAARKQRERDEKLSDLRMAVEQAKTRRTRQDAEKALSDYLAELAEEDREAERERLIESLEDEKATIAERTKLKQDEMDAERDRIIADYEARREVELEQLQANQDAAYEKLAEKLDEQLELRKAKQDEQLQAYRESLDAEYAKFQEHNASLVEKQTEQNAADLQSLKEHNAALLAEMDARHAAQVEAVEASGAALIEAEKTAAAAALAQAKADNDLRLQELRAANDQHVQNTRESNEAELQNQQTYNNNLLNGMRTANQAALTDMKATQDGAITSLKRAQEDAATALKRAQEDALGQLKTSMETGAKGVTDAAKTEMDKLPPAAEKTGQDSVTKVKAGFTQKTPEAKAQAKKTRDEIIAELDPLVSRFGKIGENATSESAKKLSAGKEQNKKSAKAVSDEAIKGLDPLVSGFGKTATNAVIKVSDTFKSGESKSKVEGAAATIGNAGSKKLESANQQFEGSGKSNVGAYAKGVGEGDVSNAVSKVVNSAISSANGHDNDYRNLGRNFAAGFANGISDNAWAIESAASNAAINAYNAAMNALNAHSPSRKMMEVGKWFDLGMAEGIDRSADEVGDSARNLATMAMDATQVDAARPELFDADALRRGAGLYMDEYQRAMSEIEDMTRRFAKTQGDLLVEGMATAASRMRRQFETMISSVSSQTSTAGKLMQEQMMHAQYLGQLASGARADYGQATAGYAARMIETAAPTTNNNIDIDVTINNPSMGSDVDIREIVRTVKVEIRREAEMSLGRT